MYYCQEQIITEKNFPFSIFNGSGFADSPQIQAGGITLHKHDCLEINYTVRGEGVYIIGDKTYPIRQGDMFLINNSEYHAAVNRRDLLLKVLVFDSDLVWQGNSMDYQYLKTFFEWKDGFKHHFTNDNLMVEYIVTILYEIEQEWEKKQVGYKLIIKALLLKILAILYRYFESSEKYSQKVLKFQSDYNKIVPAIDYIDANYQKELRLEELAALSYMNPNYFSTFFKETMHMNVFSYINRKRISSACLLLNTTKMSVTDIALATGFQNISYFNKVFKAQMHMSPSQFRIQKNTAPVITYKKGLP